MIFAFRRVPFSCYIGSFFASFLASIFDRCLIQFWCDLGPMLATIWRSKSVIFGIDSRLFLHVVLRGSQEGKAPRGAQEAPRASKRRPGGPKRPRRCPQRSQEVPKRPQERPRAANNNKTYTHMLQWYY